MRKIDRFETKLLETVKRYSMLKSGDRILVALSGGKDSVSLLYALNKLSAYLGITVCAFHLNHGIRGEEADFDEELARRHAELLRVEFRSARADIPSMLTASDTSLGLEAVARDVRYSELEKAAESLSCTKIATAHTASDNSETLLMTLVRNSNARGIPPVRGNIVRPLIRHTTDEVIEYCRKNSLELALDSTNADDSYTRNFVRHKILPELYKLSPSFDAAADRFSQLRRADEALTARETEKYFSQNSEPMLLTSLKKLSSDGAYYNVLYKVIAEHFAIELSYNQFDCVLSLLNEGTVGQRVTVSDKKSLTLGYEYLELTEQSVSSSDYEFTVSLGKNPIPDSDIVLYLETPEEYERRIKEKYEKNIKVNKLTKNNLIKYNIIASSLLARSRRSGDKIVCRGLTRSIKKYMIDEKIPSDIRSRIPIVCDESGIVWLPGLGVCDRVFDISDGITYSLSVEFENKDS